VFFTTAVVFVVNPPPSVRSSLFRLFIVSYPLMRTRLVGHQCQLTFRLINPLLCRRCLSAIRITTHRARPYAGDNTPSSDLGRTILLCNYIIMHIVVIMYIIIILFVMVDVDHHRIIDIVLTLVYKKLLSVAHQYIFPSYYLIIKTLLSSFLYYIIPILQSTFKRFVCNPVAHFCSINIPKTSV